MEVYKEYSFIRHAVPENDARSFRFSGFGRDMLGQEDQVLAPEGREHARRLAPALAPLGLDVLLSSQMKRASETADILAEHSQVPRGESFLELNEIAPGTVDYSGNRLVSAALWSGRPGFLKRPLDELVYATLSLHTFMAWYRSRTEGGDDPGKVQERLDYVYEMLRARPERRIGVVCHGYVILALAWGLARDSVWQRRHLLTTMSNCSVTRIDADEGGQNRRLRFVGRRLV